MLRPGIRPALSFLNFYSHLLSMGAHLSSPKTEKTSCCGGDFSVHTTRYGASSMQGWRVSMEDAHLALPNLYQNGSIEVKGKSNTDGQNTQKEDGGKETASEGTDINNTLVGVYGVFDGHGGSCVSQWISENFATLLKSEIKRINDMKSSQKVELKSLDSISEVQAVIAESLQSTFLKVDEELQRPETEQALRMISEKSRNENPNDNFVDSSSLLKVLLPDRVSNRKQTIRLIEQHTERLLRESFNFHRAKQSDVKETDEITNYSEYEGDANKPSEDNFKDDDMYADDIVDDDTVMVGDGVNISATDDEYQGLDNEEAKDSLVTRTVNDNDTIKSGDCITEDDYDMDSDSVGDGDSPNLAFGCGSTSVVMVVLGGESPALLVANAGDSRAVLSRGGKAVPLSHDHKPQLREESERIRRAGGSVTNGRVDGNLNLSRSLGDLAFKRDHSLPPAEQRISAMPDVRICPLTPEDEFVVLACDGIWDCKSNQHVIDFVRSRLLDDDNTDTSDSEGLGTDGKSRLAKICEELCDECLSSNPSESEGVGCDNMTVIIVQLNKNFVHGANSLAKPIALYGREIDAYLQ